jgi:hypothetical protein
MNRVYIVTAHDYMDTNDPTILAVFSNHDAAAEYWAACIAKMEKYDEDLKDDESNWSEWKSNHPFKIGETGIATDFTIDEFEVFDTTKTNIP